MFLEVFRQNYTLIHNIFLGNLPISVQQWLKLHVFRFKYIVIYSNCKWAIKSYDIHVYIIKEETLYNFCLCDLQLSDQSFYLYRFLRFIPDLFRALIFLVYHVTMFYHFLFLCRTYYRVKCSLDYYLKFDFNFIRY